MFEYDKLSITWSGHAGFKIIYGNMKVYIDPYKLSKTYEKISDADIVLITHNHFDHLSIEDLKDIIEFLKTPERFNRLGAKIKKGTTSSMINIVMTETF